MPRHLQVTAGLREEKVLVRPSSSAQAGDGQARWGAAPRWLAGRSQRPQCPGAPLHCTTKRSTLSHTVPLSRVSCEQLWPGHSRLSYVLGWRPKKIIVLI